MTGYNKILPVLGWGLLLIILAALQIAVLDPLFGGLNLVLLLLLVLVVIKKYRAAIFSAWIGGFLIGSSHFSKFGLLSAIFLIIAVILITLHKTVFFTPKTESVAFMGLIAIFSYHFLEWLSANFMAFLSANNYEDLSSYLLNRVVLFEFIVTEVFLLIIVHVFKKNQRKSKRN